MARELDALPRRKMREDMPARLLKFFLDELDFIFKADAERVCSAIP
jgi:hypothetical protein